MLGIPIKEPDLYATITVNIYKIANILDSGKYILDTWGHPEQSNEACGHTSLTSI
jgi:hypothetical protein